MQKFTLHTVESAPEGSKPILEEAITKFGRVDNFWTVLAESPAVLNGYHSFFMGLIHDANLSTAEQALVMLAASVELKIPYLVAAVSFYAPELKLDPEIVQAVREKKPIYDKRLTALREFTEEFVRRPGRINQDRVQAFLDAGFTNAQLLEAVGIIAVKPVMSLITQLTDVPLDEPFVEFAWKPPRGRR